MKYIIGSIVLATLCLGDTGCRKFVQAPLPTTELVGSSVYSTNLTSASAVSGILSSMESNCIGGGANGISALVGLSADDFALYPGASILYQEVYLNAQLSATPPNIWSNLYNIIYQANSAISGIMSSAGVTSSMRQQLVGEAECIRAFCYFYLVNLYGDVPLVLTPNYQESEGLDRTPVTEVFSQIRADLIAAQGALSQNYLAPNGSTTTERVRPNAGAAAALLARVYLYNGNYDSAELEATNVINNNNYSLVMDLDSAFLVSNTEAIWQLEVRDNNFDAPDGSVFLLSAFGGPSASHPFVLSDSLEYHFEQGDLRRQHWTDSIAKRGKVYYYAFKYQHNFTGNPAVEYPTLIRLAEMYLVRAEVRAQRGNLTGALADLNVIRVRAGLGLSTAVSQADVLAAVMQERRMEFFSEYGHRWMDLKRTGALDAVMQTATSLKGGAWTSTDSLFPLPLKDIQSDTKLTQNPGYN